MKKLLFFAAVLIAVLFAGCPLNTPKPVDGNKPQENRNQQPRRRASGY